MGCGVGYSNEAMVLQLALGTGRQNPLLRDPEMCELVSIPAHFAMDSARHSRLNQDLIIK